MGIYFNNTFLRRLQLRQRHNQQSRFSSYLGHKGEAMAPGVPSGDRGNWE